MRSLLALIVALVAASTVGAGALDLHAYWDSNCATCHGHSADFARRFLAVKDGKLQGRHHVDNLATFLSHHYLPADLVAPITAMLQAQVSTSPRFKAACGGCHETAATLVRETLALRDGVLVNRNTGRPTVEFLRGHAGLTAADVPAFVETLERVTREVGAAR